MLQGPLEDPGQDLHVAVAMSREARARRNAVVIDHAETSIAHPLRFVIMIEGEGVAAIEPVVPADTAPVGGTNRNHHASPFRTCVRQEVRPPTPCPVPQGSTP